MKKILQTIVIILMIFSLISIWPLCLIRRTSSFVAGTSTSRDVGIINEEISIKQCFSARENYLKGISIVLSTDGLVSTDGEVVCELQDRDSKVLFTWNIPIAEIAPYSESYYDLFCNKRIKKREIYYINIYAVGNSPIIKNTIYLSDMLPENGELYYNDKYIDGELAIRYFWALPLNLKNVLCIWAIIIVISATLLEIINVYRKPKAKNTKK